MSVARSPRTDQPKSPRIDGPEGARVLSLRMQDASSVEIALEQPTTVRLWVEDTDGSLQAVRRHIP